MIVVNICILGAILRTLYPHPDCLCGSSDQWSVTMGYTYTACELLDISKMTAPKQLSLTTWHRVCQLGLNDPLPTIRGTRAGINKQRPIRPIVTARSADPPRQCSEPRHQCLKPVQLESRATNQQQGTKHNALLCLVTVKSVELKSLPAC